MPEVDSNAFRLICFLPGFVLGVLLNVLAALSYITPQAKIIAMYSGAALVVLAAIPSVFLFFGVQLLPKYFDTVLLFVLMSSTVFCASAWGIQISVTPR